MKKFYTFKNNEGREIKLPASATIKDLIKLGIDVAGIEPQDAPMPKNKRIYVSQT